MWEINLIDSQEDPQNQQHVETPYYYKLVNTSENLVVILGAGLRVTHNGISSKMHFKEINSQMGSAKNLSSEVLFAKIQKSNKDRMNESVAGESAKAY